MTDTPTEATGAGVAATSQEAAVTTPEPAAEVDYNALLDQIPDEVLRRHGRVNGYAGRIAENMFQRQRTQFEQESLERARRQAQEELDALAESDPFAFSQKHLSNRAKEKMEQQINDLRTKEQEALMETIGQGYGQLPEWREIAADPNTMGRFQQAMVGKQGYELAASFNAVALDLIAERRAAREAESRTKSRLDTEVEARVQERLAARLRGEAIPDMSQPASAAGRLDPRNLSQEEFDRWYRSTFRI